MSDLDKARSEPKEQLWDQIEDVHAGMLGIQGSGQHMQPMAPQSDRSNNTIWFFSRRDSDLTKALGQPADAQFCIVGADHDYHACIAGKLCENADREQIDRFWNPIVAAWFEGGKDDPALTLLQFTMKDAAIWASSSSPLKFGWEIVKANATAQEPDLGVQIHVIF